MKFPIGFLSGILATIAGLVLLEWLGDPVEYKAEPEKKQEPIFTVKSGDYPYQVKIPTKWEYDLTPQIQWTFADIKSAQEWMDAEHTKLSADNNGGAK